jgi:lipoprotein-anchoring transpeptidase ErfK/SrfK
MAAIKILLGAAALAAAATAHASAHQHEACARYAPGSSAALSYVGVVKRTATAFRTPGRHPLARFGRVNVNGYRTLFAIRRIRNGPDCRPTWYRVQLPIHPNGATAWIAAERLEIGRVTTRIVADLSERRLTLFRAGRPVLQVRVSIGKPSTPTPRGQFYVNQKLRTRNPNGPFGPAALGISAYSNVLTGWTQGGPIAVHGTNRPDLIGRAVSTGCLRVTNSVMRRLFAATPAGTPVSIRA